MLDRPAFQQQGIELLLKSLRESTEKVDILSFGSARAIAAAFNRDPALIRTKARRIHLCAGASSPEFLEWNVMLDPHAIVRLLRSDLPIAIYPCASEAGPFAYGPYNTFWTLKNLDFLTRMSPKLRRYMVFALSGAKRVDFLRALEEDPPGELVAELARREHRVWETVVWMQVAARRLVCRADGHYRLVAADKIQPTDRVLVSDLQPCRIEVADSGRFRFELTDRPTNFSIYHRADPVENEKALREALPALYLSFTPPN
jgi:pyrimidine-specific ribonucleoside hydrolase